MYPSIYDFIPLRLLPVVLPRDYFPAVNPRELLTPHALLSSCLHSSNILSQKPLIDCSIKGHYATNLAQVICLHTVKCQIDLFDPYIGLCQSGCGSNGNEWVLYIFQNVKAGVTLSDCLMSCPGHTSGGIGCSVCFGGYIAYQTL